MSAWLEYATMQNLFSDLDGHEKQTLFVVGNGFDLYHGLPTSYSHFYHWLKGRGDDEFVNALERLYPSKFGDKNLLWHDFEKALGEFDIDSMFDQNFKGDSLDWYPQIKNVITNQISQYVDRIKDEVKEWTKSIDVSKAKKMLPLPVESKYLTFNYTPTLECIYDIPASQICHIHGSCLSDKDVIVGHDTSVDTDKIEDTECDFWIGEAKKAIADTFCSLYKKSGDMIYKEHSAFFVSLKGIDRIVVLGHSLSKIDIPYFGQIKCFVDKEAHWHLSKFSIKDEENIDKFVNNMELKKYRWIFNL